MNDIEQAIEWLKENLPSLEDYGEMIGAPPQYCGIKYVYNDPCGYVFETAIEALQEKLGREQNPPLTLEELRGTENQPVWINDNADISNTGWLVWSKEHNTGWFEPYTDDVYGSDWLAYRHKPDHLREGTNKLENVKSGEDNG